MAFGLKYELLCNSKKSNLYTAKISFDGYAGSPVDRNVPLSPFKLKKDKAAIVRGTSFTFSIREEVDFEFIEFYTNSNKKVKVELYDPSDNLIWVGFNLPQQYQTPYTPCPNTVTFTASDGLGLLKNESFTLTGRTHQLDIIKYCINKIGLSLGYSIAINTFEITHSHDRSPLEQTFEDCENFEGLKCYEVIEKILGRYDAEITQSRGRWSITCSADKKSTRMLYTSAIAYEGTESAPAVLDLGYPGPGIEVSPKGSLQMDMEPGGKQVHIKHEFGRKNSFFGNSDFSKFTPGTFPDFASWTRSGTFTPEQRFTEDGPYLFIPGYGAADSALMYQEVDVDTVSGQDIKFSAKLGALGYLTGEAGNLIPIPMIVKMLVTLTSGSNVRYLTTSHGWSSTPAFIYASIASQVGGIPSFFEVPIITNALPFSGTLRINLYRYEAETAAELTFLGVAFSGINIYPLVNNQPLPAGLDMLAKFTNSNEPNDLTDITLLTADAPDIDNNGLLYKNITWLDGSAIAEVTTLWHRLGSSATFSLIQLLSLILASNNRVARQKLTGEIKGTSINFDSIIKHAYNGNREFEIAEGEWDIYEEKFAVTLLELLSWSNETVVFTPTYNLSASSSSGYSSGAGSGSSSNLIQNIGSLGDVFEIVNQGLSNEYLRCKLPFSGDYEVQAWGSLMVVLDSHAFQTPAFSNPIDLDATIYKDFICGAITGNTTINLNNTVDGDAGMIKVVIDSTGGYTITLGSMFTEKLGAEELDVSPNMKNYISWRKAGTDIVYTIAQIV